MSIFNSKQLSLINFVLCAGIPQFEPLFSSNRVEVTVVERPQAGKSNPITRLFYAICHKSIKNSKMLGD